MTKIGDNYLITSVCFILGLLFNMMAFIISFFKPLEETQAIAVIGIVLLFISPMMYMVENS